MLDLRKLAAMAHSIPSDTGGGSPLDKLYVMAGLGERLDLKSFVEIGVYRGRSLFPLAWSFAGRGGRSYGIDPFSRAAAFETDLPPDLRERVTEFIATTDYDDLHDEAVRRCAELQLAASCELIRETSDRAIVTLRARGIVADMVHVDGNHDRLQALRDVSSYIGLMAEGAILVIDDTDWPSIADALAHAKERLSLVFETGTYAVLMRSSDDALIRGLGEFCRSLERHALRFMTEGRTPKVSVSIITFNQEDYIGQAIESALAQQTDFDVEIVIGEDGSTDRTLEICRHYRDLHPDRIHLIERPKNLGAVANYLETYRDCRGDYVAFLEGDDFWTDPGKLRKQVRFLDRHRDYAICFHNVFLADSDGTLLRPLFDRLPDTTAAADLCRGDYISTPSCMVRNGLVRDIPKWMYTLPGCDWPFDILNAGHGKIKYLDETMAAYRQHTTSIWTSRPLHECNSVSIRLATRLDRFFDFRYREEFASFIERNRRELALHLDVQTRARARIAPPAEAVGQTRRRGRISTARKKMKRWLKRLWRWPPASLAPEPANLPPLDLIVIDDAFPHPQSAFRLEEYDTYLAMFERARVFTNGQAFAFFNEDRPLAEVIAEHDRRSPALRGRTLPLADRPPTVTARFGYAVFAGNAWANVEFFEARNIPFAFTLYPGGAFVMEDEASDRRLRKIFSSPMFRKVIVTQTISRDYLLRKSLCEPDSIEFIYGVVTPEANLAPPDAAHLHYKYGKDTLDICFTAHKYTPDGHDKGYDIFLDVARALAARFEDCRFHVVGGFGEDDLPIAGLEGRITFYGGRDQEWLRRFYRDKDLILLCNVPFVVFPGAFDGFPTACGSDAMLNEVALFCTDPLNLNCAFVDGQDMVIVPHEIEAIVDRLSWYREHPDALRALGSNGRARAAQVYGFEAQLAPRLALLQQEIIA
ncbi:glycosyltransferase [Ancylobacter sp. TS-1]|uniref:glycosyltransferase n=1 Tax=Ancylobacter sp. TS-1 TaxID=1850374 RepID=UPI001265C67A|nr:glycosyltransferase [Ancylobacter sp. TS-1]QFR34840.1 glycosyltransferase [Ancylobacter sp. TS-1]